MSEAIKVACVVVLMVGTVVAVFVWTDDRPSAVTWVIRVGLPVACVAAVAVFLKVHFRKDKVPDYLARYTRNYFNRNGFCFALTAENRGGICYLTVYFQNQYDRPFVGRVALRPSQGFFMNRPAIPAVLLAIDCDAAGFGIARTQIPVPEELQGKRQLFEVGAAVGYPQGKGSRVRFRDGTLLSRDTEFCDDRGELLAVAGVLTGHIIISFPTRTPIVLPANVATDIPDDRVTEVQMLWRLGDPPIE
jgi:hypothetical protein